MIAPERCIIKADLTPSRFSLNSCPMNWADREEVQRGRRGQRRGRRHRAQEPEPVQGQKVDSSTKRL